MRRLLMHNPTIIAIAWIGGYLFLALLPLRGWGWAMPWEWDTWACSGRQCGGWRSP